MAKLQGDWTMVSGSADGQPMPDEMRKQMKRVCKGDETTTTMGGRVFFTAKITIDPSKTPKTIDYQMTEGFTKGKRQLGIYEVDGDTFKACFGKPGAERPTDFTSKAGDGRTTSVWKREKPAKTAHESDGARFTAEQAGAMARDLANEKAQTLFKCRPFQDGVPAHLAEGRWSGHDLRGQGNGDIKANVAFAINGENPDVRVTRLDNRTLLR
jgi:uncharacterized protein (TIGR03067 family)